MRTRYLFSTCLLTALLVSGFALPFQAEAWNGDYHYGYRHPRLNFSFRFGYPIYPSMGLLLLSSLSPLLPLPSLL